MIGSSALLYAQALYDIAVKDPVLTIQVAIELELLSQLGTEEPRLTAYFESPLIEKEDKYRFLKTLMQKMMVSDEVHGLIRSTIKWKRFIHLRYIAKAYRELLEAAGAGSHAFVTSARELTREERVFVKKRLEKTTGKKLIIRTAIDTRLIGGVRADVGHTIFDSSVKNRLNRLKAEMSNR
jgi:F-type H+-transporting ATPase subunit delta